jgi:hypothetical protein
MSSTNRISSIYKRCNNLRIIYSFPSKPVALSKKPKINPSTHVLCSASFFFKKKIGYGLYDSLSPSLYTVQNKTKQKKSL